MHVQLPLTLGLRDSTAFESYLPGPNVQVLAHLRALTKDPGEPIVYIWGAAGTGKTHLLQAVCHAAGELGEAAIYLPMGSADQLSCEALEGIENIALVCIDDINAISGRDDWELALMRLFVRVQEAGGGLVVAGAAMPVKLGLKLTQLSSRLAGGLVFQIQPLDEAEKLQALELRAARRGLDLPVESGRYLVRHYGRDVTTLFEALDTLDKASLAAKRKLTVPFIRNVLSTP